MLYSVSTIPFRECKTCHKPRRLHPSHCCIRQYWNISSRNDLASFENLISHGVRRRPPTSVNKRPSNTLPPPLILSPLSPRLNVLSTSMKDDLVRQSRLLPKSSRIIVTSAPSILKLEHRGLDPFPFDVRRQPSVVPTVALDGQDSN